MKKATLFTILTFAILALFIGCNAELAEAPTISAQDIAGGKQVSMSTTVAKAQIRYTLDGSDPTDQSYIYSSPFNVDRNTTVKAVAVKGKRIVSEIATLDVHVKLPTPEASLNAGTYMAGAEYYISLSCSDSNATIHYTTDGQTPTAESPVYSSAITINKSATVKAIAIREGLDDSEEATFDYKFKLHTPSPADIQAGSYMFAPEGEVHLVSCDCNAEIYFTIDGSEPTKSSLIYGLADPITITEDTTLKLIAFMDGYEPSDVGVYEYKIGFSYGAIGPAGGYMFYDCDADNDETNGGAGPDGLKSSVCGWQYLEAAPSYITVGGTSAFVFGYYRTTPNGENLFADGSTSYDEGTSDASDGKSTGTAIGTGKANTTKLVNKMGSAAYTSESGTNTTANYAAKICDDYTYGSYSDWFLPSKDELNLMYTNLKRNNIGGFTSESYWSSSENGCSTSIAHGQYFFEGTHDNYIRSDMPRVRAIRSF